MVWGKALLSSQVHGDAVLVFCTKVLVVLSLVARLDVTRGFLGRVVCLILDADVIPWEGPW